MAVETFPFDIVRHLDTDRARAIYMTEALETNDPAYIMHAIEVVARSRQIRPQADLNGPAGSRAAALDLRDLLTTVEQLGLRLTTKHT